MTHPRWALLELPLVVADILVPVVLEIGMFPVALTSVITSPPDLTENPLRRGCWTLPVAHLACKSRPGDEGMPFAIIAFTTYAVTISRTILLNGHGQILSPNLLFSYLIYPLSSFHFFL